MNETDTSKIKSFSEVQLAARRDIIENLAMQLEEMYCIADDNFTLIKNIIHLDHALMSCRTYEQVLQVVDTNFTDVFQLPYHVLKLTIETQSSIQLSDHERVADPDIRNSIQNLHKATTGQQCIHPDLYTWFDDHVAVASFLHLPLIVDGIHLGLLLIGHENPDYFAENAPTDYVEMMAQSVAITLNRILGQKGNEHVE